MGDDEREAVELRRRIADLESQLARAREREAILRAVLEAVPATIVRTDAALHIVEVNRTRHGTPHEQVLGRSAMAYVPPGARAAAEAVFERALRTGESGHYTTPADIGPLGPQPVYDCYVARIDAPDGGPPGLLISALDVTDQRRRDAALRQSEEWLRVALDATGMGLWSLDLGTGEVVWNEHMHAITGSAEPLGPDAYAALVHPDDRAAVQAGFDALRDTASFASVPHRIVRRDGAMRWVITVGKVVTEPHPGSGDAGGTTTTTRAIGGMIDATAQHQTDERVRAAQRMESLGQLAAGIAHNFNNMLAAIVPALELLRPVVPASRTALVDDAMHAALRAAEMVRQLMRFAGRRQARAPRVERVGDICALAVNMCRPLFERHIALEAVDCAADACVRGEAGEVEQVLVNILLNARDAVMAAGRAAGRIRVESTRVDGAELPHPAQRPGQPFVRIRVTDDGEGMTPEVRARAFEPFFTTKEPGRGTGLGLATVYTTVREHGGAIVCESTPGVGTTFDVYLPCVERVSEVPEPSRRALPMRGRGELILLVDDEETVRRATMHLLEGAGYTVAAVTHPPEALAMLGSRRDVAVVLLFHATPETRAMLREARHLAPAARTVLVTGHSPDDAEVDAILSKPAAAHELLGAIRDALDRPPR